MNKRVILIACGVLILGVGSYFGLQALLGPDRDQRAYDQEQSQADSLDAIDREIQKHRETLLLEQGQPQDYVEIKIDPMRNLFGESVIEGEIRNKATGTRYKDFELMIYWQDETGTVMDSAAEVVFQEVAPGETITFKTKRKGPRKSKAIQVKLHRAVGQEN